MSPDHSGNPREGEAPAEPQRLPTAFDSHGSAGTSPFRIIAVR